MKTFIRILNGFSLILAVAVSISLWTTNLTAAMWAMTTSMWIANAWLQFERNEQNS